MWFKCIFFKYFLMRRMLLNKFWYLQKYNFSSLECNYSAYIFQAIRRFASNTPINTMGWIKHKNQIFFVQLIFCIFTARKTIIKNNQKGNTIENQTVFTYFKLNQGNFVLNWVNDSIKIVSCLIDLMLYLLYFYSSKTHDNCSEQNKNEIRIDSPNYFQAKVSSRYETEDSSALENCVIIDDIIRIFETCSR